MQMCEQKREFLFLILLACVCRVIDIIGIVGTGAWEMIAESVLAIEMGAVARDVMETIHPHPTLSETVMESAEMAYGNATHTAAKKKVAR